MRLPRRSVIGAALAAPMLARHGWAQSNDWPKGPVRWVVAFAAGGAADTVARNIGVRVAEIIGQQVTIDNRTGGNAVVAQTAVLQAPRDGQTFLIDAANQLTNEFLIKDVPFNYEKTWLPVSQLSIFPQVVAVKEEFPARTIQRMQQAVAEACKDAKVQERLAPSGAELVANSPAEFGAWLKAQRILLGKLIADANIKLG